MNMPLGCGLPNQRVTGQGRDVDAEKHTVDTFFPVERWGQDVFCLIGKQRQGLLGALTRNRMACFLMALNMCAHQFLL